MPGTLPTTFTDAFNINRTLVNRTGNYAVYSVKKPGRDQVLSYETIKVCYDNAGNEIYPRYAVNQFKQSQNISVIERFPTKTNARLRLAWWVKSKH
jgi:hypothetical protein